MTDELNVLSISQFDEDIISLAFQLQKLRQSDGWPRIKRILLHVRPSDGRINGFQLSGRDQGSVKEVPGLKYVKKAR